MRQIFPSPLPRSNRGQILVLLIFGMVENENLTRLRALYGSKHRREI